MADIASQKPDGDDQVSQQTTASNRPQGISKRLDALDAQADANTVAIEEINARGEMQLRDKALTYSKQMTFSFLAVHIGFAASGHPLILPDIVNQVIWSIIVAPWIGHGMGKIVSMFLGKTEKK